jgi:hypothetical protein
MMGIIITNNFCSTTFQNFECALASNIGKMANKFQFLHQFLLDFLKVLVHLGYIIVCPTRLVNFFEKKLQKIPFSGKFIQKRTFHKKQSIFLPFFANSNFSTFQLHD